MFDVDDRSEEGLVRRDVAAHQVVSGIVDRSLDLGVDDATWQDERRARAERNSYSRPGGVGSTEAEKTELVTFPAIRAIIVPPFCAKGSDVASHGLIWGLMIVAVDRRRRRLCRQREESWEG